jgi:hypothetical protein
MTRSLADLCLKGTLRMTAARRLTLGLLATLAMLAAIPAIASAAASLQADPSPLDFGASGIHDNPKLQTTTITNVGDEDATLEGNTVEAPPFHLEGLSTTCNNGVTLAPAASCVIAVTFIPETVGPASETFVVKYNDSQQAAELNVGVTGIGALGTLSATTPTFNSQPYYFGGQERQVGVSNESPFSVGLGEVTIAGAGASAFNINFSNCSNITLGPGGNCNFNVQFNPSGPGTYVAEALISNNGDPNPVVIPLEVVAQAGPKAVINPASTDFGAVEVGTAATTEQVSITNAGDAQLQIQQLLIISGTPQAFPITNDGCSLQEIAPGDKCEFTLGFTPNKAGERYASIFVITNTPGPVTTAAVTAEGFDPPDGSASLTSLAQVGVPITCLTSGYRDADELSYKWVLGATAISGATQSVYVPVQADIGSTLSCEVTAVNPVATQTVSSAPSPAVIAAAMGPQGPAGPDGDIGPQGPAGAAGPEGATGTPGAAGTAGPKGDTGPQGKQGKRSKRGKKGKSAKKAKAKPSRHAKQ